MNWKSDARRKEIQSPTTTLLDERGTLKREESRDVGARGNVQRRARDRPVRDGIPDRFDELSQTVQVEAVQRLQILLRAERFRGANRGSVEYRGRREIDLFFFVER